MSGACLGCLWGVPGGPEAPWGLGAFWVDPGGFLEVVMFFHLGCVFVLGVRQYSSFGFRVIF